MEPLKENAGNGRQGRVCATQGNEACLTSLPLHQEILPYQQARQNKLKPDFMSSDTASNSGPVVRKGAKLGAPNREVNIYTT